MENVRYNISPCSAGEVEAFVKKIDPATFVPNGVIKATDRSHYDRYSYTAGDSRVAIVYDTSANILSVTGPQTYAEKLRDLFAPSGSKTVKMSTVPAQGSSKSVARPQFDREILKQSIEDGGATRAKLFVSPDALRRRAEFTPVPTMFMSSKGAVMTTDEIYPPQVSRHFAPPRTQQTDEIYPPQVSRHLAPQRARQADAAIDLPSPSPQKRKLASYGESSILGRDKPIYNPQPQLFSQPREHVRTEHGADSGSETVGVAISVANRQPNAANVGTTPRRAVISFGSDDDGKHNNVPELKINTRVAQPQSADDGRTEKRRRGRPPKAKAAAEIQEPTEKRKRGRPPKTEKPTNAPITVAHDDNSVPECKSGDAVKNFPPDALAGAISRLKADGKIVTVEQVEFSGEPQEVKNYTVSDSDGQKVFLRYATKRMTLQLQGKSTQLLYEVMSQIRNEIDATGGRSEKTGKPADGKAADAYSKLKKRLPTAYDYLSEQSRIDFSYGLNDFSQHDLHLSDYSVLLVPAFRGLERFVFDLQSREGIKVKMIGQAFDKDDEGRYILKSGYTQRMTSVVYPEVLVALYTEYFSQRNFFAHSDNTDSNVSRSLPERAAAQRIFEHILDVVEYNAKKLNEIKYPKN